MTHNSNEPTQYSYLLRVWKDSASGCWRASLKNLMSLENTHFSTLGGMFNFICEQTEEKVWIEYLPVNQNYEQD